MTTTARTLAITAKSLLRGDRIKVVDPAEELEMTVTVECLEFGGFVGATRQIVIVTEQLGALRPVPWTKVYEVARVSR